MSNNAPRQSISKPRVTQRQPLACLECTRRKVKCDKRIPCSRCHRAQLKCTREKVRVSNVVAKHGEELNFLSKLEQMLGSPGATTKELEVEIRRRITDLQAGDSGANKFHDESVQQHLGQPLSLGPPLSGSVGSGNSVLDRTPAYAATITLESLAWGRNYGGCYPHRRCNCYHYRSASEMVSISSNLSGSTSIALVPLSRVSDTIDVNSILPSVPDSIKLVKFHITHLAWHHGILHAPTFLDQCEVFWTTGTYRHPLWMALYLSVLSARSLSKALVLRLLTSQSTLSAIQNSTKLQNTLSIFVIDDSPRRLFEAMIQTLYSEKFLEVVSLYSVQAITLSTEVAHNLGFSDLNATLMAAAIRISQCMGLHKIADPSPSMIEQQGEWHETVERELGKRVWCQIVIQDHFGLCFTDSYNISPKHCSTEIPRNCDDHDLEERHKSAPTITSYIRTLAQMATLVPRLFDELGPLWSRKPLREQYRDVINGDREMRRLVGDIPQFLLREDTNEQLLDKPWLDIARRSLAITAAEKIILIHRPFLFPSFQTSNYSHTRLTCVSAATTIVREYGNIVDRDYVSLWEHSACCVTASIILCLELLYPQKDVTNQNKTYLAGNSQKSFGLVNATRQRLASRRGDIIARRGARLIDTMLSIGGFSGLDQRPGSLSVSQGEAYETQINLEEIVARFLEGDTDRWPASREPLEFSNTNSFQDMDPIDVEFDTWFEGIFKA